MFDSIIGTLLSIPGKTKDHVPARKDLKVLREEKGISLVPDLEIKELEDGSEEIPISKFSMTVEEKRLFCQVIKNAELPQRCASNFS